MAPIEKAVTFQLTALPAEDGDCLILTYGGDQRHHVVIDGGRSATYPHLLKRMEEWVRQGDRFTLLVVTHFDGDHIEGVLRMVKDPTLPITPEQVWFNGYDEVSDLQALDAEDADELSDALRSRGWRVNRDFGGRSVCIADDGPLPKVDLDGGLELIILSPDEAALTTLLGKWDEVGREAEDENDPEPEEEYDLQSLGGLSKPVPDPVDVATLAEVKSRSDKGAANRASIAFLAKYAGKSVLFAADAHPDLLVRSLDRLDGSESAEIDIVKLSHHGSKNNNPKTLLEKMRCDRYLISSSGRKQSHPDPETIARILTARYNADCVLYFNYRQKWTELWADAELVEKHGHACVFPNDRGLTVIV